jgi:hypothetical protein
VTIFLESPMPILAIGIVVEAILVGFLVSTRRGVLLAPMAGVLVLVLIGLAVERLVVTEREKVADTLYDAAKAIESNDVKRVESFIAKTGSEVLRRAARYMNLVEFESIKLHNLKVQINRLTSPPTAEARFDGTARYQDRTGTIPYGYYSATFRVTLVQEPDGWKVKDIEGDPEKPLTGGNRR